MKTFVLVLLLTAGAVAPSFAPQGPQPPGPEHEILHRLAGTWDTVISVAGPEGAEQRKTGEMTARVHGGYHLVQDYRGRFMGTEFFGHGIHGYCPVRERYFAFWTDSMTPSPMTLEGDYDSESRTLTMRGRCYGMSGKLEPCRTVTRFRDDDHVSWSLFGPGPDGKEMRLVHIDYVRQK